MGTTGGEPSLQPREGAITCGAGKRDTPPLLVVFGSLPHGSCQRSRGAGLLLTARSRPPPRFDIISYDVPPRPPEEIIYVERPVLIFDDPDFGFEPPPRRRYFFLRRGRLSSLAPPPRGYEYVLPVPVYCAGAGWVNPPRYICAAAEQLHLQQHSQHCCDQQHDHTVTVTNPAGQTQTSRRRLQSPASQPQFPAAGPQPPGAPRGCRRKIIRVLPALPCRHCRSRRCCLACALAAAVSRAKGGTVQNTTPPQPAPVAGLLPGQARNRLCLKPKADNRCLDQADRRCISKRQATGRRSAAAISFDGSWPSAEEQGVPETKGGQPLPGAGGPPLPSVNGRPPVAGQPQPSPFDGSWPSAEAKRARNERRATVAGS